MRSPRIHPSILNADFANLASELNRISTADAVHVDVMDNHFVPNLTIGLPVVRSLRAATDLPLRDEVAGRLEAHGELHAVIHPDLPRVTNVGFLVDDALFHPGDGVETTGLGARALAAPISGPSISFRDAYRLTQAVGAETVVPIHYDLFTADPRHFAQVCDIAQVVALADGETTEV